ncbi:MAG TPA: hypothetical protein VEI97_17485 [bacterium]|nr:hypothetical protein [bacterium]
MQQVLYRMGLTSRFLDIMRMLGFAGVGDMGIFGFPTDFIVPSSFAMTPEIQAVLGSLDPASQLAMYQILQGVLGMPTVANPSQTTNPAAAPPAPGMPPVNGQLPFIGVNPPNGR